MIAFLNRILLPFSIMVGTVFYFAFTLIEPLQPLGRWCGPRLLQMMPYTVFVLLYLTFCKIDLSRMRPRMWHLWVQVARISLSLLAVWAIVSLPAGSPWHIVLVGVFACVVCPTAAAAPLVTGKLGGDISSMTTFMLIGNLVSIILIPALFPLVHQGAGIPFLATALLVFRRVTLVLLVPLLLAVLTRRYLPALAERATRTRDLPFYLWCMNLSIVSGLTIDNTLHAGVGGNTLLALIFAPLGVCLLLFALGKGIGHLHGDTIGAGQALGQKNTIVAIWLTITFLHPLAAVSPGAYVLWQNLVNSFQLWAYGNKHK